jgi:salicylate hydroxylase
MSHPKYHIAILGSGPIGKLLIACVRPHPLIEYIQYEAETLLLRPSFGYGIGPQTFATTKILNPAIYEEMLKQSFTSPVWMNFLHAEDESVVLPAVKVPDELGVYGRLGREELMGLLDGFRPEGHAVRYGMKVKDVLRNEEGRLELVFEDGRVDVVDAVWACDGMNSLCRKLIQGDGYRAAEYSGLIYFRGKARIGDVEAAVGTELASKTHTFVGGKGYFVLVFPIDGGKFVNIAAFSQEVRFRKPGRAWKTGLVDMLAYFPQANPALLKLLEASSMPLIASTTILTRH